MASRATFRVDGLEELERHLLSLDRSVGKKVLETALISSMNKISKKAKRLAPERTGKLRKAIFKSKRRVGGVPYLSGGQAAAQATMGIKRFGTKGARHAHLQEYGTRQRFRRRRRNEAFTPVVGEHTGLKISTGRVRGKFFMHKAWQQEGGVHALNRFKRSLQRKIRNATR